MLIEASLTMMTIVLLVFLGYYRYLQHQLELETLRQSYKASYPKLTDHQKASIKGFLSNDKVRYSLNMAFKNHWTILSGSVTFELKNVPKDGRDCLFMDCQTASRSLSLSLNGSSLPVELHQAGKIALPSAMLLPGCNILTFAIEAVQTKELKFGPIITKNYFASNNRVQTWSRIIPCFDHPAHEAVIDLQFQPPNPNYLLLTSSREESTESSKPKIPSKKMSSKTGPLFNYGLVVVFPSTAKLFTLTRETIEGHELLIYSPKSLLLPQHMKNFVPITKSIGRMVSVFSRCFPHEAPLQLTVVFLDLDRSMVASCLCAIPLYLLDSDQGILTVIKLVSEMLVRSLHRTLPVDHYSDYYGYASICEIYANHMTSVLARTEHGLISKDISLLQRANSFLNQTPSFTSAQLREMCEDQYLTDFLTVNYCTDQDRAIELLNMDMEDSEVVSAVIDKYFQGRKLVVSQNQASERLEVRVKNSGQVLLKKAEGLQLFTKQLYAYSQAGLVLVRVPEDCLKSSRIVLANEVLDQDTVLVTFNAQISVYQSLTKIKKSYISGENLGSMYVRFISLISTYRVKGIEASDLIDELILLIEMQDKLNLELTQHLVEHICAVIGHLSPALQPKHRDRLVKAISEAKDICPNYVVEKLECLKERIETSMERCASFSETVWKEFEDSSFETFLEKIYGMIPLIINQAEIKRQIGLLRNKGMNKDVLNILSKEVDMKRFVYRRVFEFSEFSQEQEDSHKPRLDYQIVTKWLTKKGSPVSSLDNSRLGNLGNVSPGKIGSELNSPLKLPASLNILFQGKDLIEKDGGKGTEGKNEDNYEAYDNQSQSVSQSNNYQSGVFREEDLVAEFERESQQISRKESYKAAAEIETMEGRDETLDRSVKGLQKSVSQRLSPLKQPEFVRKPASYATERRAKEKYQGDRPKKNLESNYEQYTKRGRLESYETKTYRLVPSNQTLIKYQDLPSEYTPLARKVEQKAEEENKMSFEVLIETARLHSENYGNSLQKFRDGDKGREIISSFERSLWSENLLELFWGKYFTFYSHLYCHASAKKKIETNELIQIIKDSGILNSISYPQRELEATIAQVTESLKPSWTMTRQIFITILLKVAQARYLELGEADTLEEVPKKLTQALSTFFKKIDIYAQAKLGLQSLMTIDKSTLRC